MIVYFANPCTEAVRDVMSAGLLGCITTPAQGNVTFPDEWDVIADNGCFSDKWDERAWFRWLLDQPRTMRFAVCPDVFDPTGAPCHDATMDRWVHYGGMMARHGFTPAFVCQVGCTADTLPHDADVLFLGGTTEWKLGPDARAITAKAKVEGRWVHMGLVNSQRRLTIARDFGCDSVDGTYLAFGPDQNLPRLLAWLAEGQAAPMLWEAAS